MDDKKPRFTGLGQTFEPHSAVGTWTRGLSPYAAYNFNLINIDSLHEERAKLFVRGQYEAGKKYFRESGLPSETFIDAFYAEASELHSIKVLDGIEVIDENCILFAMDPRYESKIETLFAHEGLMCRSYTSFADRSLLVSDMLKNYELHKTADLVVSHPHLDG